MAKPKKATKKKPAVKKKSAKPAPKKKSAKAKAKPKAKAKTKPKAKAKPIEQADLMRMDGMKVPSKEQRTKDVAASQENPNYAKVRETVLGLFRSFYPSNPPESDEEILEIDPNDFDVDPGPFYETMADRFKLADDPNNDYFGGFGGKIATTIANIAKRWNGKA